MATGKDQRARNLAGSLGADKTQNARPSLGMRVLPSVLGGMTGIAICVVIFFVWRGSSPQPVPVQPFASAVCSNLKQQNYTALYSQLASQLQQQGTAAQFAASQEQLDRLYGTVRSCTVSVATQGSQATLTYQVQRNGAHAKNGIVQAQLVSGAWRITSYDSSIVREQRPQRAPGVSRSASAVGVSVT